MKRFVCPDCEDHDDVEDKVKGMICECGGVMELEKPDYYDQVEYIEPCMICRNKGKKCDECRRN